MNLFAEVDPVVLLFIGAVALTTWILMTRSHRYYTRQKDNSGTAGLPAPRTSAEDRGHHLDAPKEAIGWEVRMYDTARELSAQLDSKMSALGALIADADRAAARLEAANARTSELNPRPDQPASRPRNQAETLKSAVPTEPTSASTPKQSNSESDRSEHARCRDEVYTLSDYGFTAAEIAGRVGSPIGEVELMLSLREKQGTGDRG
jgi:hypothetical protein